MPDIRVENHGSIVLLVGATEAGEDWLCEHVSFEDWQMWGSGVRIACEPRYVEDVIIGAREDGLEVA